MKCLPFIYAVSHPTAQAFYPPSYLRIGRAALKRRYTRTCSLQSAQPGDRPPAGSLLHYLLTLTLVRIPRPDQVRPRNAKHKGGYFLLPSPIVTNSFYFRKWSALCCPDFPLAQVPENNEPAIKPGHCCPYKLQSYNYFFAIASKFVKNEITK